MGDAVPSADTQAHRDWRQGPPAERRRDRRLSPSRRNDHKARLYSHGAVGSHWHTSSSLPAISSRPTTSGRCRGPPETVLSQPAAVVSAQPPHGRLSRRNASYRSNSSSALPRFSSWHACEMSSSQVDQHNVIYAGRQWQQPPRTGKAVPAHIERDFFAETCVTAFRPAA